MVPDGGSREGNLAVREEHNSQNLFLWLKDLYNERRLIMELAITDLRIRYAASKGGILWAFIQPFFTVLIYVLVFGVGLKIQPSAGYPYVPWLVAGIIPWFFFQDTVMTSTTCLREYSYLVKKMVFNVRVLPAVREVVSLLVHIVFIVLCLILHRIYDIGFTAYYFQIPYYLFCNLIFSLGVSYLVCALCVFYPDLQHIITIILQFGIWFTPIMWHEMLFGETVRKLLMINPIYYIVSGYRDSLYGNSVFWQKPLLTIWFWLITLTMLDFGIGTFQKLEDHFGDVL